MEIDVKPLKEGTQQLNLRIENEDFAPQVEAELKKLRKKITMPGFRPGRVPMSLVRKQYGDSVRAETIQKLINEKLNDFIKENNLMLYGQMLPVNTDAWAEEIMKDNPEFVYEYAPVPDFEFPMEKLKEVPLYKIEVTGEDVDKYIKSQQELKGDWKEAGKFDEGVLMFFEIQPAGEADDKRVRAFANFKEASENEKVLKILRKLEEGKTYEASFKYVNDLLKLEEKVPNILERLGITPKDKVALSLEGMEKLEPAELNEDFFEKVFPGKEIKDEETFRQEVKNYLEKVYADEAKGVYYTDLYNKLMDEVNLAMPEDFLKRLLRYDKPEITDEEIAEILTDDYRKNTTFDIIVTKYFRDHDLKVDEEEFVRAGREETIQLLKQYNALQFIQTQEQLDGLMSKWMEENPGFSERVHLNARTNIFFRHLAEQLQPEEKTIKYDELVELLKEKDEEQNKED